MVLILYIAQWKFMEYFTVICEFQSQSYLPRKVNQPGPIYNLWVAISARTLDGLPVSRDDTTPG